MFAGNSKKDEEIKDPKTTLLEPKDFADLIGGYEVAIGGNKKIALADMNLQLVKSVVEHQLNNPLIGKEQKGTPVQEI